MTQPAMRTAALILDCSHYVHKIVNGFFRPGSHPPENGQFLFESMLVSLIALVISIALIQLALPTFNQISEKHLSLTIQPLLAFIALGFLIGIIAGIYPSFILSSFKPALTLKGNFAHSLKGNFIRKALVVVQFSITIALVASRLPAAEAQG